MINRSPPSRRPSPSGTSSPFMGRSRRRRRRGGTRPPIAFLRLAAIRVFYIHVERRRVAIIVSPWYPVPPSGYGGIELIAYNLRRGLANRGPHGPLLRGQGSPGPFESLALPPESSTSPPGTLDALPG